MNAIKRIFQTVSFLGLGLAAVAVSGCGEVQNVKCTASESCIKLANDPTQPLLPPPPDGGSNLGNPVCCGGYCLIPAEGCDTPYRYLDNDPGYGTCAPAALAKACPAP